MFDLSTGLVTPVGPLDFHHRSPLSWRPKAGDLGKSALTRPLRVVRFLFLATLVLRGRPEKFSKKSTRSVPPDTPRPLHMLSGKLR